MTRNTTTKQNMINYLLQTYKFYITLILGTLLLSNSAMIYAKENTRSVNILSWWGYLEDPQVITEITNRCNVNVSSDVFYTNNEFLRRIKTNKADYDIIILSDTVYRAIKNDLPKIKTNLSGISDKFHPVIRQKYLASHFPNNVIYFVHSISGFLWNPELIDLSEKDQIRTIFKKSKNNIVVLVNDPIEIWNLINKANDQNNTPWLKKYDETLPLSMENFLNVVQNKNVYLTNNYNQTYDQPNFAFSFGWIGDAITYMNQSHKKYKFLLHPDLSYISADLLVAMNDRPETICIATSLMSKKILNKIGEKAYYFSPYGDYTAINSPEFQNIYQDIFKKLPYLPWLESVSAHDYAKIEEAWNQIEINLH